MSEGNIFKWQSFSIDFEREQIHFHTEFLFFIKNDALHFGERRRAKATRQPRAVFIVAVMKFVLFTSFPFSLDKRRRLSPKGFLEDSSFCITRRTKRGIHIREKEA